MAYKDIEALLSPGFITDETTIGYSRICLRSLSPGDLFLLNMRQGGRGSFTSEWAIWLIATSTWLIDGVCVIGDTNFPVRFAQTLRTLPHSALNKIVEKVLKLVSRASQAEAGVEAFSYEPQSRQFWRLVGRDILKASGHSWGESLGLNNIQRLWIALNEVEDTRLEFERQWSGFKLVASAHSPKGVEKIDSKDKKMWEDEVRRRETMIAKWKGEDVEDAGGGEQWKHKTFDDLREEYKAWVSGQKDFHDTVVEQYKEEVMGRVKAVEEQRARTLAELRAREDSDLAHMSGMATPLIGLSPDQVMKLAKDSRTVKVYEPSHAKEFLDLHAQRSKKS